MTQPTIHYLSDCCGAYWAEVYDAPADFDPTPMLHEAIAYLEAKANGIGRTRNGSPRDRAKERLRREAYTIRCAMERGLRTHHDGRKLTVALSDEVPGFVLGIKGAGR